MLAAYDFTFKFVKNKELNYVASCNTYLPVVSASINIPNFTKAQADKSQSINEKSDNECKTTLITRHTKLNMFYKLHLSFNHHI